MLVAVVASAVIGGGAVAAAEVANLSEDVPTLREGMTIGYLDLKTGEPILCPGGEPLTYTHESTTADASQVGNPECSDGSVPPRYTEQARDYEEWLKGQDFGTSLSDGPTFSYEIEPTG